MSVFIDDDYLLLEAAKTGQESKVRRFLLAGCHSNAVDLDGRSALHWAAEYGYMRIVYLLVESQWNINLTDNKNQTPLHTACNHRKADIATCLITLGCDVNTIDIVNGNTPLHRAVHADMETVVFMLCDAGADVKISSANGWTPLHEAMRTGNENITQKFIRHGADLNARTQNGMTPFLTAIFYYRISQRNSYLTLDTVLKLLIDNGCRLSDSDGQWSHLSSSIAIDNSLISAYLIFHGCQIERPSPYRRSILVEAFTRCEPVVTKLLISAGYQITLDELDQCSRRIPVFSKAFMKLSYPGVDNGRGRVEILQWLRRRTCNAVDLSELCRTSIRQALNLASGDRTILSRIEMLPLPACLKNFIAMKDYIPEISLL